MIDYAVNNKAFRQDWLDDLLQEVQSKVDPTWRHGNYMCDVFKDEHGRFWKASYQLSGDGEYHGIRDNNFSVVRVYPVEKVIKTVEYVTEKPV